MLQEITVPQQKVLLIDLENCPNELKKLAQRLEHFDQVLICYAGAAPKLPLDLLQPVSAAMQSGRLQISKMAREGKNSADFGLCFYAGVIAQDSPPNTDFTILSNDSDLDYLVDLLRQCGHVAERHGKPTAATIQNQLSTTSPLIYYCQHLLAHPKTRPASEKTIKSSIKARCGCASDEDPIIQKVLSELQKCSAIHKEEGKIVYREEVLRLIVA